MNVKELLGQLLYIGLLLIAGAIAFSLIPSIGSLAMVYAQDYLPIYFRIPVYIFGLSTWIPWVYVTLGVLSNDRDNGGGGGGGSDEEYDWSDRAASYYGWSVFNW